MQSEGVRKNQSVGKALLILEAMAEAEGPVRLLDLSQTLSMPASTVLRFLTSLVEYGYVQQERESNRYYLTLKLASLGSKAYSRYAFKDTLRTYLEQVSREVRESVSLSIAQDMNVVYIDAVDGPDHMLQTLQRIGKIAPMHSTGAGKILLFDAEGEKLEKLIQAKGLPGYTPHTITTKASFLEALESARKRGYAYDDEECELGVRCIAVPIRDFSGKVVASISVSAPTSRMGKEREGEILDVLIRCSRDASAELGFSG